MITELKTLVKHVFLCTETFLNACLCFFGVFFIIIIILLLKSLNSEDYRLTVSRFFPFRSKGSLKGVNFCILLAIIFKV